MVVVSVVVLVVVTALVAGTAVATVSTVAAEADAAGAADSTGAALAVADTDADAEAAASPLDSAPLQPPRIAQHAIAIKFFILSYLLKMPLSGALKYTLKLKNISVVFQKPFILISMLE